jgi:type I restriction-modification system DNA methylase subunit
MAIKKSELYSSLWASCDGLRGGMDASQYKDYVVANAPFSDKHWSTGVDTSNDPPVRHESWRY